MKNIGEKVCVSFANLHNSGITDLTFGGCIKTYEEDGNKYYDLIQDVGPLIGCDGETWEITDKTKKYVRMRSEDTGNVLYLSQKEYEIAAFE